MNQLRRKQELLVRKLKTIWKDKEFILGIICTLQDDDEVQMIMDFIDENESCTPSDITTQALLIANYRNKRASEEVVKDDFYSDIINLANKIK